ncbi:MAG: zinc-binding dehydrogenase [Smithella sp.]
MNRQAVYFTQPGAAETREEALPPPAPGEVLVKTILSAVSSGTEMLVYRHQVPQDLPLDSTIAALSGNFDYPVKYGYSAVGQVIELGQGVDRMWREKLVFAFHPHESHFTAAPGELLPLPEEVAPEDAVFLANMETAVNFLMDGQPIIGEQVVVFGQGIVGLLTTAMLAQIPLGKLVTVDKYPQRRRVSREIGATFCLEPDGLPEKLSRLLHSDNSHGADLVFELSGNPEAFNQAIAVTGFDGRVVLGSWYGQKTVNMELGGRFHRSRIRLISSQVSTLSPGLTGRWNKARRLEVAWRMLAGIKPSRLISHRFAVAQAPAAYQFLDNNPGEALQVVFTY